MWFIIVLVTIYVKKEEEKAYHAVMLDTLSTHDFKMEVYGYNNKLYALLECFNSWLRSMTFLLTWFLVCTRRQRRGKTVCDLFKVNTTSHEIQIGFDLCTVDPQLSNPLCTFSF